MEKLRSGANSNILADIGIGAPPAAAQSKMEFPSHR